MEVPKPNLEVFAAQYSRVYLVVRFRHSAIGITPSVVTVLVLIDVVA
jgi:hypothetical protein